jgi:hypothetical protein
MDDCVKWMTYEFLISDGWPSISLVQIDHLKVPHHGLLMSLLFYSVDMEDMSNTVSFRNSSSSVPFVLHVDKRGFATVPERLLSLRFNLLQQSLLVEKEEFDHDGILVRTVYQKPNDINGESIFVVFPGVILSWVDCLPLHYLILQHSLLDPSPHSVVGLTQGCCPHYR